MGRRQEGRRRTGRTGEKPGKSSTGTGGEAIESTGGESRSERQARLGIEGADELDRLEAEYERRTERVGVLPVSSNDVTIDEQRLTLEADAALAGVVDELAASAPADAAAAGVPALESWAPFIEGLAPTLRGIIFAQWRMHEVQFEEWKASLVVCLDQTFPGGMTGPYACWVRLATASAGIVVVNYVTNGNQLPPLGLPRAAKTEKAADTGTAASPQ